MARAKDKIELINSANEKYLSLIKLLDIEDAILLSDFNFTITGSEAHWKRDKNIRDVLFHLYRWHQLLLDWLIANINGEEKSFLPSGYNWKNYSKMNEEFFAQGQEFNFDEVNAMLAESHNDVINVICRFSDNELFNKNVFSFTGTTTLGSYCISATSSHYDWAMKKIKLHIKTAKASI